MRSEIQRDILNYLQTNSRQTLIQWLEIIPETYVNKGGLPRKHFDEVLAAGVPLIPHGVNLSIGSAPQNKKRLEFDFYLLKSLKDLFNEIKAPWFSDHLAVSRIGSHYFQELLPVPFTKEAAEIVSNNIKFLEDYFQLPFLFENPAYYTDYGLYELREQSFINLVLEKARCGLLLDISNVIANALNHKYLPKQFLDDLDLKKVVQIHLGGLSKGYTSSLTGHKVKILDSHTEAVSDVTLELFEYIIKKTKVKAVLLERDGNFTEGGLSTLLYELKEIRRIMDSKYDTVKDDKEEIPEAKEAELSGENQSATASNNKEGEMSDTAATPLEVIDIGKNQLAKDLDSLDEEFSDLS